MLVKEAPGDMDRDKSSQTCGTSTHNRGEGWGRARNTEKNSSPEAMDAEKNSRTDKEGAEGETQRPTQQDTQRDREA